MRFLKKGVFLVFSLVIYLGYSEINVGIYKEGAGVKSLLESLKAISDFNVKVISDLNKENIKCYDVLIFSNTSKFSNSEKIPIFNLISFVQEGKGVLFTHNACGRFGVFKEPLFPSIAVFDGKTDDFKLIVVDKKHPIASGLPREFKHSYWDHINLQPGERGSVIIEDVYGKPVVVVGKPVEKWGGRVVYMGNIPGIGANEREVPVKGSELVLLTNAIKWLSKGERKGFSEREVKAYLENREKEVEALHKRKKIIPEKLKRIHFNWKAIYLSPKSSPGFYTRDAVKLMVKDLKRMGINAVLPYIFSGEAYYLSKQKEVDVFPPYKETNFDFLKILCEEAHKEDITVIPVICPFVENVDGRPSSFIKKHPEYLQISKYTKIVDGVPTTRATTCPDRPEVRKRYLNIIKEIITNYPVDGISLDYIRYQDNRSCWCPYSVRKREEFAKKHPDLSEEEVELKFSEETIVGFVKDIRKIMDEVNPHLILHAYTHPYYANKFPLTYHSKRTTSAWWDVKNNKPKDLNFATLEQTYQAAKNLINISRTYYKFTKPAPMVDIASGTPPDRIWKSIRTVGKAGARDIVLMGYNVNSRWFGNWLSVEKVKKVVSEELDGKWTDLKVPLSVIPHIKAKPNFLPDGSFEKIKDRNLKNIIGKGKVKRVEGGRWGKICLLLEGNGSFSWEPVKVKNSEIYTLSAWVKAKGNKVNLSIYLYFFNKDKKPIYVRFIHLPDKIFWKEWYKIGITRTSPKESRWAGVKVLWNCPDGKVFLDGVKLEEYPIGTDYE